VRMSSGSSREVVEVVGLLKKEENGIRKESNNAALAARVGVASAKGELG
jgi:hypothetical protein